MPTLTRSPRTYLDRPRPVTGRTCPRCGGADILFLPAVGKMKCLDCATRKAIAKMIRQLSGREQCRADILDVIRRAGEPLQRKEVVAAMKAAGHGYGRSTVAKALADLTATGALVNTSDKQGYRPAE